MGTLRRLASRPPAVLLLYGWLLLLTHVAIGTSLARADSPQTGGLSAFAVRDSKGIDVGRFALSLDAGNGTDLFRVAQVNALSFYWDAYRWSIGGVAVMLDWTASMDWVVMITGPLYDLSKMLRESVLAPIGATSIGGSLIALLLIVAAAVAATQVFRGKATGWLTIVESCVFAVVAVGALSSPVFLFAGDSASPSAPLRMAQRIGVQLSTAAVTGKIPEESVTDAKSETEQPHKKGGMTPDAGKVSPTKTEYGALMVDTFIRPVHQMVNYGAPIDAESEACAAVYDNALKEAQSEDDLKKAREKLEAADECDDKYGEYAKQSNWSQFIAAVMFQSTGQLVTLVVIAFIVLQWLAVLTLGVAALKLLFHLLVAILPGDTKQGFSRDMADVVTSLVYVVVATVLLGVVMATVKAVFQNPGVNMPLKFLGADALMLAAVVLLVMNFWWHRKGAKTLGQRFGSLFRRGGGKAAAAAGAGHASSASGGSIFSPTTMVRDVANSRAARSVMTGAKVASVAASGGTTLAVGGTKAALAGAKKAHQLKRSYDHIRGGEYRTTGNRHLDVGMMRVARAHNAISDRVSDAKALHAGEMAGARHADHRPVATTGNAGLDRMIQGAARQQRKVAGVITGRPDQMPADDRSKEQRKADAYRHAMENSVEQAKRPLLPKEVDAGKFVEDRRLRRRAEKVQARETKQQQKIEQMAPRKRAAILAAAENAQRARRAAETPDKGKG